MRELDMQAVNAKDDNAAREFLIRQNEYYILKCASKVCHRYITKSDDEWSVSLIAFSQAIESYHLDKGSFLKFAELVIKRRLIDYSKNQGKYRSEIFVAPDIFETSPEEDAPDALMRAEVAKHVVVQTSDDLKLEIDAINKVLGNYGFTFMDLTNCSPHAAKTRKACATAINYLLQNPVLISDFRQTGQLPLKIIEKNVKVPRKILERHRKYIIAATEILSGDYPNIAEYLNYIREEN